MRIKVFGSILVLSSLLILNLFVTSNLSQSADASGRIIDEFINQAMSSQGNGTGVRDWAIAVQSISGATTATPTVLTAAAPHGYLEGDYIFIEGATGTTEINGLRKVKNPDINTFEITKPDGTEIGTVNIFGGTVTCAIAFVYVPRRKVIVERFVGYAHDDSYDSTKYLGIDELPNGIEIKVFENDIPIKTLTTAPVKKWIQWACNAGVDAGNADGGVGQQTQTLLRWSIFKSLDRTGLIIDGRSDQLVAVIIRDTLTGLLGQELSAQGHT